MLVVCNGMLRSGSTLQYNYVRTLVERTSSGVAVGHAEPAEIDDYQLSNWAASKKMTVVKMHGIDPRIVSLLRDDKAVVCYIFRDLRHVAASIRRKWNPPWPEIISSLDEAVASRDALTRMPGVLVQRYEEVLANDVESVQQLSKHLGLDVTPGELVEVARLCSPTAVRELGTGLTARQRISHSINSAGQRLPHPIRLALHRTGLVSAARKLGVTQNVYDQRTLLHPDHITSDPLNDSDEFSDLSDTEITELNSRYEAFLRSGDYSI